MFTKKESCEIASHQTLLDEFEGRGKNGGKKMSKEKLGIEREWQNWIDLNSQLFFYSQLGCSPRSPHHEENLMP